MSYPLKVMSLALTCFTAALAGHYLVLPGLHISPLWPAAGIGVAGLILWGKRLWPGIAVAVAAATWIHHDSAFLSAGFSLGATVAAVTGASLVERFRIGPRLEGLRDVLGFIVAGASIPAIVSATIVTLVLAAAGENASPEQTWAWWWIGDLLGGLILGPLVLAFAVPPTPALRVTRWELVGLVLVTGGLVTNLFLLRTPSLAYTLFIPAIWAGLRLSVRGAALIATVVAAGVLAAVTTGRINVGPGLAGVLILLSFLVILTITGLVLAAVTADGLRADLRRRQDGEVQRAVVAGSPLAIITLDTGDRVTGWNAAAERIFGYTAAEMMGRVPPLQLEEEREAGLEPIALSGLAFSGIMVRRRRKDGAALDLSLSTAPLRDDQGKISGVVEILADLTDGQKADEMIRQREARLKLILDQALDAVITIDVEGRITGWNPQAERIFGWSASEVLGHRLADTIVPQRLRASHDAGIRRFLLTGNSSVQNRRLEMPGLHRMGHEFPVELTIGSVRQGDTIIFSAFVRDITEQKRAENALRASEDRYRAFIAQSTEAIWCFEFEQPMPMSLSIEDQIEFIYQHGYLSDCNEEMARMYGFTRAEDLVGLRLDQFLVRADLRNVEFLKSFIQSGYRLTEAESHEVDREGRNKFFLNNMIGIAETGMLVRAWGTQRDITERREAECRTTAFASLALELSGANDAVEAARTIVEVAQDLCGWESCSVDLYYAGLDRIDAVLTVDQVDGQAVDIPPAYTGRGPSPMARRVITEGSQLILRGEDGPASGDLVPFGSPRPSASLMFVPIRNKNEVIGILSIQSYKPNAYDMADLFVLQSLADQCGAALERIAAQQELRRTEAQLRQAQKMEAVGRLAGGIAHDFNNLLTTILGTCDLLLEELPREKQWREDVEEIRKAGDRAASLTRQLLAFSRKQVIEAETINLNETVASVSSMLRRVIGEDIELVTRLEPALGMIRADSGQLEQVLMNLAVNSRDAMPSGGTLIIETANVQIEGDKDRTSGIPAGAYVMLAVSDNGIGMDAETQSHIFEPFFTTKELGKGTGLGLATVYGIVRQSGGYLSVYSEPGIGATFKVYLPPVDDTPTPRVVTLVAPRGGSETILVAEDEPAVRNLARRVLESHGYDVMIASNAEEALAMSREFAGRIHLLLTDVIMPGLSGPQLADHFATERKDSAVLFMSGYTDTAISHHGALGPGVWYLQKPFSPVGLAEKVREVLDCGD